MESLGERTVRIEGFRAIWSPNIGSGLQNLTPWWSREGLATLSGVTNALGVFNNMLDVPRNRKMSLFGHPIIRIGVSVWMR
jgi:hypothetical protein